MVCFINSFMPRRLSSGILDVLYQYACGALLKAPCLKKFMKQTAN